MSDVLTDILAKRRDRAIAVILGVKEREVDPILNRDPRGREVSSKLRKVVLDQINELHELTQDMLKSMATSGDVVLNDVYLEMLARIHDAVVVSP